MEEAVIVRRRRTWLPGFSRVLTELKNRKFSRSVFSFWASSIHWLFRFCLAFAWLRLFWRRIFSVSRRLICSAARVHLGSSWRTTSNSGYNLQIGIDYEPRGNATGVFRCLFR